MYIEIQNLKKLGLKKAQIARKLGISRPTVNQYFDMSPDEFQNKLDGLASRIKKPEKYHDHILAWLKEFSDISSAQIYDWLEEKFDNPEFTEGTLRNYVRLLRKQYNIPKEAVIRQYEALDDPPMGKQMQVDFGEIEVKNSDEKFIKVYCMCFVLSHSRYKYCKWHLKPFTTSDIVAIHEDAFEFFGGMTEEIVYDQDHLILVSENHGDLIFTKEFASYHKMRKFKVYMCHKRDPESKGRIEKVVDFVKNNFAINRTFYDIDRWNEDCIKWLKRRGNGKIHGTTRKIPEEVFSEEKKYLHPILDKIYKKTVNLSVAYRVRKDNTVPIGGNRYGVPRGTYKGPDTCIKVIKVNNQVVIYDINDVELTRYDIPVGKGHLLKNTNHKRDNSIKIDNLMKEIIAMFSDSDKAAMFLKEIKNEKSRYIRDHLTLIKENIINETQEVRDKAVDFCVLNKLYSGVDFKDAIKHFSKEKTDMKTITDIETGTAINEDNEDFDITDKIKIKPEKRDISVYSDLISIRKKGEKR